MTKKEWIKCEEEFLRRHRSGGVLSGYMRFPPTPTIGVELGVVAPWNSVKSEKVAPVSNKKVTDRPSTTRVTLGSRVVILRVGCGPGLHQSSSANPTIGGQEGGILAIGPSPLREKGQSEPQCPVRLHLGQGLLGGRG